MKPAGLVLYDGPSRIGTRGRIVAILTGLEKPSKNRKTGPMFQLWILAADVAPHLASRFGLDELVCGSCPLRRFLATPDEPFCYVNVQDAPTAVWRAWTRGAYVDATGWDARRLRAALAPYGRAFRFGAYGEPAALPAGRLRTMLRAVDRWTAYTHRWREFPSLRRWAMASVDNADEAREAQELGWRTFRHGDDEPLEELGEILCPATEEAGNLTQCARCLLCDGGASKSRRNIYIHRHGSGARR